MRELIHNLQPTFVMLPAFIALLIFPQKIQKEKVPNFYAMSHLKLRIAASFAMLLGVSFFISLLFAPKSYIWANTSCIFLLMAIYYTKTLLALEKVRKSLER